MKKGSFTSYILITIGAILAAFSINTLLIPNLILDGGINGISMIISRISGISLSILVILLNIPFIYIGYKFLGKNFLYRTLYSIIIYSIFLTLFKIITPITNEIILSCVFGGILLGAGVGLIIQNGGCIDGTESVGIVISRKTSLKVGEILLIFNLIIFSLSSILYGLDRAMYSLLTYFITSRVVDFVSTGLFQAKAALIICDNGDSLSKTIYKRLGRTVTTIRGKGLISGDKSVLYCVLTRAEIFELKKVVEENDQSAFISISDVKEIIGDHIKSSRRLK